MQFDGQISSLLLRLEFVVERDYHFSESVRNRADLLFGYLNPERRECSRAEAPDVGDSFHHHEPLLWILPPLLSVSVHYALVRNYLPLLWTCEIARTIAFEGDVAGLKGHHPAIPEHRDYQTPLEIHVVQL